MFLETFVPKRYETLGSRWVLKTKADDSKKRRIVVLRWRQVPGRNCSGTFALICRLQTIRTVLAIAVEYNLE